jgi:hypothetical protein
VPAGTDLIQWVPRVGDTGDDRYDPGEARIVAGLDDFSAIPTIAEVNASSGVNQIRAELIRRTLNKGGTDYFVPGTYTGVTYPATQTANVRIGTIEATTKTAIDMVRVAEQSSAYSWGTMGTAGTRISRANMLAFRKALAIDCIHWFRSERATETGHSIRAACLTYPTPDNWAILTSAAAGEGPYSARKAKYRGYLNFKLPAGLPADMTASLYCWYTRGNVYTTKLFRSDSYLGPIDTGDWGNLDTEIFSAANNTFAASAATEYKVELALSETWQPSTDYTIIFAHGEEIANSGPYSSSDSMQAGTGGAAQMRLKLFTP